MSERVCVCVKRVEKEIRLLSLQAPTLALRTHAQRTLTLALSLPLASARASERRRARDKREYVCV